MAARKKFIILPILALVVVAIVVWRVVAREEASRGNELVLQGNVDIRQVELAFNGTERIAEMLAEEGNRVRKGQVLGRLETVRLSAAVARAEAQVAAQGQVVAALVVGTREEEKQKARADVATAEADAKNADLRYERLKALYEGNAVDRQAMDDASAAADAARARVKSLQEVLALAEAGPRKEDIAAAQAALKAFEAELALAKKNLADAELIAPSDGVVRTRILEVGDMASPQKPAYTLAPDDPVWVRAYIRETDLGRIRQGMQAWVKTDSFPDKRYEGWVGFISPTAQFTPKNVETQEIRTSLVYEVRVYARNPQGELLLGMPATVIVPLNQTHAAEGTATEGR